MLQITISCDRSTRYIKSVFDVEQNKFICEFDEQTQKTDIEKLRPYIGSRVMVFFVYANNTDSYTLTGSLTDVNQTEDGIWYIEYRADKNEESDTI